MPTTAIAVSSTPLLSRGGGGARAALRSSSSSSSTRTSAMTGLSPSSPSPASPTSSSSSASGLLATGSGVVALLGLGGAVRKAVRKAAAEGIQLDDHVTLKWRGWLSSARRRSPHRRTSRTPTTAATAAAASDGGGGVRARRGGGGLLGVNVDTGFAARVALALCLGVANRVLYKMALVPLQPDYVFFLAQVTTFGYVLVYFLTLSLRYRSGLVTDAMLSLPKWRFACMGVLEALGFTMGLAGAAQLPGAVGGALLPVLNQTYLVWQLALSALLLKKRFRPAQLVGAGLLVAGVVVAARQNGGTATAGAAAQALKTAGAPVLLYAASMVPSALSSIFKEWTFNDAKKRLRGTGRPELDIFVVNSFSSGFQALCVLALLPLLASLRGVKPQDLPSYLLRGSKCFVGMNPGTPGADCRGAPLLPLLYVAVNMAFNVASLSLLRASSAVVASITGAATVPLAVLAFTLPLPYLGAPASLGPDFLLGLALLLAGMVLYNVPVPALVCRVAPFLGGTCEYSCPNDNPARKCC